MWPNSRALIRLVIRGAVHAGATAVWLTGAAAQPARPAAPAECAPDRVLVATAAGPLRFRVEIADTPEDRARGLMFRREVPAGEGMLFIYDAPVPMSFWMRNTLVPLDLLFIDAAGVIRHIHPMARPLDETPIPGAAPGDPQPLRLMALEIAGGEAARLGLRAGQPVAHPRLAQDSAVWPCA